MNGARIRLSGNREWELLNLSEKAREVARLRPKEREAPVGDRHDGCYTYRIAGPSSADPRRRCYDHQIVYVPKYGKG